MRAFESASVGEMAVAQIGPFTAVFETLAAAVGAGVVIGSVAAGMYGLWDRCPARKVERRALSGSYIGGAVGAAAAFVDAVIRYGIMK